MKRALLIMGPTASGKSALALALAARLDAEIVNADSMQVYADLRVLTARPNETEEAQAPHHLFGVVDAAERFSVGAWTRMAAQVLDAIAARGKTALVVGGTGLYFKALTQGLAEIAPIPEDIRERLAQRLALEGAPSLHADLAQVDPNAAARIAPQDGVRILRALEVFEAHGEPISALQANSPAILEAGVWAGVALTPPRAELYARIEARFAAMLAQGALEEARALAARRLDPLLPCMKAHGMPWLAAHLGGEMTLAEAQALSTRDTRRYAKRQTTWINHQMEPWPRLADWDLQTRIEACFAALGRLDRP
jgi:tRNA dimethylallyltransferase